MSRPVIRRRLSVRYLLNVAAWCLVLGGLFAMHGLGNHGVGSHDSMAPESPRMIGMAQEEHQAPDKTAPAHERVSNQESPSAGMSMVMTCMAVLFAAVVAFVLVLLRHLRRRPMLTVPRVLADIMIVGRDRDPPCLARLSVMRC